MAKTVEPDNDVVEELDEECEHCNGAGSCQSCDGDDETCLECDGSGDCQECDGTGEN